jgi:hypothetical protein
LDVPDGFPDVPAVSSLGAQTNDAVCPVDSEHQPEFYVLSGEERTESSDAHEQDFEGAISLQRGQNETPQISQAGTAPVHVAASTRGFSFWSSAVKLSRKAGNLVDKARNAVAEETCRCVDDVRQVVQDTRLIGEKMTLAGETLSATVGASGVAIDKQSQLQTALESIKQGLAVTADVSWDILRDVDEGQREFIGAIKQGIRSEWTEPATFVATDAEWTTGAVDSSFVQGIGPASEQAKDARLSSVDHHVEAQVSHTHFGDVKGWSNIDVSEAWPQSRQQGAPLGTGSGSMKQLAAAASGSCEEESIFIIGSDDEDAFFNEPPALEHRGGESTIQVLD